MTGQSAAVRPLVEQIQARPRLQRGWEVSLAAGFTGFVLLAGRVFGSLPADSDIIRGLGTLWLVQGGCLMAWLAVKSLTRHESNSSLHRLCWAGLLFAGTVQTSLALLPLQSFAGILGGLFGLLLLAGFLTHDALESVTCGALDQLPTLSKDNAEAVSADKTTEAGALEANSTVVDLESAAVEPEINEDAVNDDLTQWLKRKRLEDGGEEVEGMLRLEMASGQTQRSAHVTFSPALAMTPEIECEPLCDVDVEASIGDAYPHGFRVDVRRGRANAEAVTIEIGFQAIATADTSSNAA
ncbi:hypothetical protein [Rubinisphaera sp. JC750]|uniref:hypothetical protein n=1 Tax=Rubinisphaera sp. JC750 TaxID=2898658 RepID=UPI001F2ACE9D|nr:hypothetical protein [Rubinisphaera sp. JC750]